jgi:hypothetical protein
LTGDYDVIATWQVLREALRLEERAGGLLILQDLERLRADDMLSQDKELEIWRRIRDQAPGLFAGTALTGHPEPGQCLHQEEAWTVSRTSVP